MKPTLRKIPSDDCAVAVDGILYHPHEGEHIMCAPGMRVRELGMLRLFRELSVKLGALKGETDEVERVLDLLETSYGSIIPILADRIPEWTWTDAAGRPYPQPKDDPKVFERLEQAEISYLINAIQGETPGEEKNALSGTGITSSATASQAMVGQSHTPARSRGKA